MRKPLTTRTKQNRMAVFTILSLVIILYSKLVICFTGEFFVYNEPVTCNDTDYFNSVSWKCVKCDDTRNLQPSDDGLSCVCNGNSKISGADDAGFPLCEHCGGSLTASKDQLSCITCANSSFSESTPASENASVSLCRVCGENEVLVERFFNGSLLREILCVKCVEGTVARNGKCVPCSLIGAPKNSCKCDKLQEELAGYCVPHGKLLDWPNERSTFTVEYDGDLKIDSRFLREKLRSAVYQCKLKNHRACQSVANLCTLTLFGEPRRNAACRLLSEARSTSSLSGILPALLYGEGDAPAVLSRRKIPTKFGLDPSIKDSLINLTVASFTIEGDFLGFSKATADSLTFCFAPGEELRFGVPYTLTCKVAVERIIAAGEDPRIFQIFLKYLDQNEEHLHTVPILTLNIKDGERYPNKNTDISQWQLVQRFFLAESLLGHPFNPAMETEPNEQTCVLKNSPAVLRYAKSIHIKVRVRSGEERGRIFPPLLVVEYAEIRKSQMVSGAVVTSSLSISYEMENDLAHAIEVSVVVLSVLALLLAGVQTLSYWRRSGRVSLELTTLLRFILLTVGHLADVFFIVVAGAAIHTFIFYKGQAIVHVLLPGPAEEYIIFSYVTAAFSLKCVEVIHLIWRQVTVDIFLLDWERPRATAGLPAKLPTGLPSGLPPMSPNTNLGVNGTKSVTQPVSVWRTYFIANEWNELQTLRRTCVPLHLLLLLLFLKVFGFEEWALNGPQEPSDQTCRFALGVLVYLALYGAQLIFVRFVYERFLKNAIQDFVDVCSLANISVFIMALDNYGFYIHGRSAHGFADTDMQTMLKQLRREEEDLAGHRGLLPEGDHQTYSMLLPSQLRACYIRVMAPLTSSVLSPSKRLSTLAGRNGVKVTDDRNVQAYHSMNHLLSAFLEHVSQCGYSTAPEEIKTEELLVSVSFLLVEICVGINAADLAENILAALCKALKDIDYEVKNKTIAESILDMEFSQNDGRGFFYADDGRSFTSVLFYGSEWTLLTFDIMLFSFAEQLSGDYLLAAIFTGLSAQVLAAVRYFAGRRNLARKTLIDERFLI